MNCITPSLRRLVLVAPLALAALATAPASAQIVVGADEGGQSIAARYFAVNSPMPSSPYSPGFQGGVRVAVGDVNGDGVADIITGPGPGAAPHVKVFDGTNNQLIHSFFAYSPSFAGGVFVAAGDINGDGAADIITGAGPGAGPHVKVFDGRTGAEIRSFFPFAPNFSGGVRVAAGDVNGDGFADIIAGAGPGGGPQVGITDGTSNTVLHSFFAYPPTFSGGVFVAAGDIDGDGRAEVVTGPGDGAPPQVNVFNPENPALNQSFFVGSTDNFRGVRVGTHMGSNGIIAILIGLLLPNDVVDVHLRSATGGAIRGGDLSTALFNGAHVFVAGTPRPTCRADFNHDGTLNPDDLADYIGCFFATPPCDRADYNAGGETNPDDLADFIGAFFAGCP